MDWKPINTIPNTDERVFYGFFSHGQEELWIAPAKGLHWHNGDLQSATHWAPYARPDVAGDRHRFINRLRSLFNIDGFLLPELTDKQQGEFMTDPHRYLMRTDRAQAEAIWREVEKWQR